MPGAPAVWGSSSEVKEPQKEAYHMQILGRTRQGLELRKHVCVSMYTHTYIYRGIHRQIERSDSWIVRWIDVEIDADNKIKNENRHAQVNSYI